MTRSLSRAELLVSSTEVLVRTGLSVKLDDHRVLVHMPLAGNEGAGGVMYAGSLFALAEAAPGLLILNRFDPAEFGPTCASVNIRFRRPATSDVTIDLTITDEQFDGLREEASQTGKGSAEFELELRDGADRIVALADVRYVLLKIK